MTGRRSGWSTKPPICAAECPRYRVSSRTVDTYDCVVVGGGAAGLSAALVLGRARRSTLLVDAGQQSNLAAHGIGGLLGFDGRPPVELYERGRRELRAYPSVELLRGTVTDAGRGEAGFTVDLADRDPVWARRLLLATGVDYQTPDLPGVADLWGTTVVHCPFCHGWELRDQPLAVLARDDKALHAALLVRGWTDDLVVLTDGPGGIDDDGRRRLGAAGVVVDERPVSGVEADDGRLAAVLFDDGSRMARSGLMIATTLGRSCRLAERLGAVCHDSGPVVTDPIDVDKLGRTTVPGLFAAGDVCTQTPQVAGAIAAGSAAATAIVESLLSEDFGLPFPPRSD